MMKIKSGFMTRKIGDKIVGIAVGERTNDFNGMINLNDTGLFIWKCLEKETTPEEIAQSLTKEYDIDLESATNSVNSFIGDLKKYNLIEE